STVSRKPCTKWVRNCSPSDTVAMPASSCSLIQISAASRLAWSRSLPSSFHFGQSFSVSASQAGFGRLPAMVAGKSIIVPPSSISPYQENRASPIIPECMAPWSVYHDAPDRLALVHEIESPVDLVEAQPVGDHRVDLDLAVHVPVDDPGHVGAAARAAEGGAFPGAAGDELERPR